MLGLDSTGEEWSMFYVFSKTAHAVGANILRIKGNKG
jgi:hypothetical protein